MLRRKLLRVSLGWNHLGSYSWGTRRSSSLLQKKSIPESVRMGTEVKLREESNRTALGVVEIDSPGGHHLQSGERGQVGEEQRDHGQQRVLVEKVENERL